MTEILANYGVQVALAGDQVVRFIAASAESIAQLYIHTDFQDRDIGSHMLQWAKDRSAGQPWLYTFARNTGARRFYEDRGFRIAVRGFEETWGLEDIRYEWKRTGQEEGS